MKTITVTPIYGYGWAEGDSTVPTPERFDVKVLKYEKDRDFYSAILGEVVEPPTSRYLGHKLILLAMTSDAPVSYSVEIYNKLSVEDVSDNWVPENVIIFATGFAEIATE